MKGKRCRDHEGTCFPSESAMCCAWGISQATFRRRVGQGWSVERALTTPACGKATRRAPCSDHLGVEYPSVKDMCDRWGVNPATFTCRIGSGWTVADALETPAGERRPDGPRTPFVRDHRGDAYPTLAAMCDSWGISLGTFYSRRRKGWSLERALTEPSRSHACLDHLGNAFPSVSAMCDAWGVGRRTYARRLGRGWSLERALTEPSGSASRAARDHKGTEWPTTEAMCEAWGVDGDVYKSRRRKGWSLERALTAPRGTHARRCRDHEGTEFPSVSEMCRHWGVSRDAFRGRVRAGWGLRRALTEPLHGGGEFTSLLWRTVDVRCPTVPRTAFFA